MKTDDLTWEKLREVAETYERATASDTRAMMVNSGNKLGKRGQGTSTKTCYRCNRKGHTSKECRTDKEKLFCKHCKAKGHASDACRKNKAKSNGNQRSGNPHKARQILDTLGTSSPVENVETDDESSDHKVGRTIVSDSDDYKVYRMTGGEDEEDEPVDGVYMTIEGGNRKTSITPPLLL